MTPTLLDPSPTIRVVTAQAAVRAPERPRRRDPGWLFPAALALSALMHVLAFSVIRFSTADYRGAIAAVRAERANAPMTGIRIVQVIPAPDALNLPAVPEVRADEPEPESPTPTVVTAPGLTPEPVATAPERGAVEGRDPGTLLDRVRTRTDDARLWAPPTPAPVERLDALTEALLPLYAALGAMNDSMAIAAEGATRATDWTVADGSGGRWGVSPGAIHLGKITLPLPFVFSPPPGRRDELSGRIQGWGAIQRQAADAAVRDGVNDRIRAIRERNQAARDSARKSGGGGG